jgi:hypothetical protein
VDNPAPGEEPAGPDRPQEVTFSWRADWSRSGASVASRAGPTVSKRIAALNAPSTLPEGFVNASVAANTSSIVPHRHRRR